MTCAIVVTFNRRDLLAECLQALAEQTLAVDEIIVVDNASTDGTAEMVRERFPQVRLEALAENRGGAGGFHHGLGLAHELGHEWLWLMDDDTIPAPGALAALHDGIGRAPKRPAMVSSQVQWTDGTLHPMNYPHPRWRSPADLVRGGGSRAGADPLQHVRLAARRARDRRSLGPSAGGVLHLGRGHGVHDPGAAPLRRATSFPRASWSTRPSGRTRRSRTPAGASTTTSGTRLLLLRGSAFAPAERLAFARLYLQLAQALPGAQPVEP